MPLIIMMAMSQITTTATEFIESHPKLLSVLFVTFVLLTQAGGAAGAVAASTAGP